MGFPSCIVETLLDKDLIVGPNFRTALFHCPDYGPSKAIKIFDHHSISEILKPKYLKRRSFKGKFKVFFFSSYSILG